MAMYSKVSIKKKKKKKDGIFSVCLHMHWGPLQLKLDGRDRVGCGVALTSN
jgi:hypothetical protein